MSFLSKKCPLQGRRPYRGHFDIFEKNFCPLQGRWTVQEVQCESKNQRPTAWHALKMNYCRLISALDFAYARVDHRPEFKLDKSVIQFATRIEKMSPHMSKTCKTLPCLSGFHDTLLAPVTFYLNRTPNTLVSSKTTIHGIAYNAPFSKNRKKWDDCITKRNLFVVYDRPCNYF